MKGILLIMVLAMFSCKHERGLDEVALDLHRNVLEYEKAKTQKELDSILVVQDSLIKEYDKFFYKKGDPVDLTK